MHSCWDVDLKVILQIGADAGPVRDDFDAMCLKLVCRADTGQFQQCGRVDSRRGDDDFPSRFDYIFSAASADLHSCCAMILDDNPAG